MTKLLKKLSFYALLIFVAFSCNSVKRVADSELLLTENTIYVDGKKNPDSKLNSYVLLRPNNRTLGIPLPIYLYNLGDLEGSKNAIEWQEKHPKLYNFFKKGFSKKQAIGVANSFIGLNNFFLKKGEAPVIISKKKIRQTVRNLGNYYQTQGYFKNKITYKIDSIQKKKKGSVEYFITKGKPIMLDSIYTEIKSPVLDSIYKKNTTQTYLNPKTQYNDANFRKETNRIIKMYRNNGIYHFSDAYMNIEIDTLQSYENATVALKIKENRLEENNGTYIKKPFKIFKNNKINVVTDYSYFKKDDAYKDSVTYNGINFYAYDKIRYNPKILAQSLFIKDSEIYKDTLVKLTRTHLRSLNNFKSTNVLSEVTSDSTLTTNILLSPIEKYTLGFDTELSRSNIRNFDISTQFSILNRNTFKGAELFKLSVSGSYFNSTNGAGWEFGSDLSLEVPRFMAPFGLHKLVPKRMFPKTKFYVGASIQKNIGLDRQNFKLGIDYRWNFNNRKSIQVELFNTQFIRNLNISNYFDIYNSEYLKLLEVATALDPNYTLPSPSSNPDGIVSFMNNVFSNSNFATNNPTEYQSNRNILNRYNIITSNFLIPVIAYSFTYNNQENTSDKSFSYFRIRIANSGNIMGLLSNTQDANGKTTISKIPLAQYFKTDFEYKKFWNTGEFSAFGIRSLLGVIVPYDNSNIPFAKSYFAGGANDIRAWRAYDLGPGKRQRGLEYNIGSLKFVTSMEFRFDLAGGLKGALFTDFGNIWDINNSQFIDDDAMFNNFSSLADIAVGSGFGMRYDFKFLIARLDWAFKVREPYLTSSNKWLQNFDVSNSVLNIGINYPF